tara:strand:+ start:202 stop:453 length:252 start_codon:yes stop_codon:yes gene_type:complete
MSDLIYMPKELVNELGGSYLHQKAPLSASPSVLLSFPYPWDPKALSLILSRSGGAIRLEPVEMRGENGATFHRPGWYKVVDGG